MAKAPPDIAQRDANLDELRSKVKEWADKEKERLDNENKFMRSVLKGRGVSDPKVLNLNEAVLATADEINDFLTG